MPPKPFIYVISSFATDTLIYLDSGEREETPGGPAFWIRQTYERMGVSHKFITGSKAITVEMEIVGREPGPGRIITNGSKIAIQDPLSADGFIINTLDDFDLEQVQRLKGTILLDLAGCTRDGAFLQQRKVAPMPSPEIRDLLSIIKVNREEYSLMPEDWRKEQMNQRILLHTLGVDGVDLWIRGTCHHVGAPKVSSKHVIGAGDTLGSSFLAFYLEDPANPINACERAISEVAKLFETNS